MQIDHPQELCAHAPCNCPVENGTSYCSEHCERAASHQPDAAADCPCGHARCVAAG
jgi:hypothetical protein